MSIETTRPDHADVALAIALRTLASEAHRLLRADDIEPHDLCGLRRRIDRFRWEVPGGPYGDIGRWLGCIRERLADRLHETRSFAIAEASESIEFAAGGRSAWGGGAVWSPVRRTA